jgi:hypothetical protein
MFGKLDKKAVNKKLLQFNVLSPLTSSTYGALCHYWIKRRARFKRNILSQKDARLCMELTALERQNTDVSKNCKDICECPRTKDTGKTKMKFHTALDKSVC